MSDQEARWLTVGFILALVAITIGYDVAIMHLVGSDATISRVCGNAMHRYPILTAWTLVGVGMFIGHVFLSAW